jgi:hypothetical protein
VDAAEGDGQGDVGGKCVDVSKVRRRGVCVCVWGGGGYVCVYQNGSERDNRVRGLRIRICVHIHIHTYTYKYTYINTYIYT